MHNEIQSIRSHRALSTEFPLHSRFEQERVQHMDADRAHRTVRKLPHTHDDRVKLRCVATDQSRCDSGPHSQSKSTPTASQSSQPKFGELSMQRKSTGRSLSPFHTFSLPFRIRISKSPDIVDFQTFHNHVYSSQSKFAAHPLARVKIFK